jgi:hypothetical protein
MTNFILFGIVVFAVGVWIGVGAPGWPVKPDERRRHTRHRSVNPIAWGRTSNRERKRPRNPGERRFGQR